MNSKLSAILVVCLMYNVSASNEVTIGSTFSVSDTKEMEDVFLRSDEAHKQSLESITSSMSLTKAEQIMEKSSMATPELMQVTHMLTGKGSNNLRQPKKKGYSGLDGARKLLNDMIYESMSKYDAEVAKCTDYYSRQCAAMEACRGQIAASNYIAANSRMLILDSQATINKCEVDIPATKLELKQHLLKCKHELSKLNTRLKIVMGDIAVMTTILEMTDCDAKKKKLLQMEHVEMLHCVDQCTHKTFIEFKHNGLQEKINKLHSELSHDLMQDVFKDLFDGIEGLESVEFLQTDAEISPIVNKTKFSNPPVPRTKVPGNPCNDPDAGAPSAADKRAAKCTLGGGQCYKLQERFLLIQSGIQDERDELLEQIEMLKKFCEETKGTLQGQIGNAETSLSNAQTKLAAATEKEATAGETARQTAKENDQLNGDLVKQMKTCSTNYISFETEICALKKIRGELYKMKGDGHSGFFQDCEVSKWDPEECTKVCKRGSDKTGGTQKLTRNVLTHPNGGTKCLPLAAQRSCNNQPCPVDCKLSIWSGWSKCSAQCGSGVSQRLREVKVAMRFGGKPCGGTSETRACNTQACEKDCVLTEWTKWSGCSKDCDGGTQKRQKFVKTVAEGAGKCAGGWSLKRLEYKECNKHRCKLPATAAGAAKSPTLTCDKKLDVVLLLDGSGSLGAKGWEAEKKAALSTVSAFANPATGATNANIAVILYSGPRTWGGVRKCIGKNSKKVDMAVACKVKTITHFNGDLTKVKNLVAGLTWPKGSTLTSLALMTAKAELPLGRKDAHSNIIVFTDGRPLSFRKTKLSASLVRKSARLLWVPVTKFAPMKAIKKWATRRWQENVVQVKTFGDLSKPDVVNHIIADICPKSTPKVAFSRR